MAANSSSTADRENQKKNFTQKLTGQNNSKDSLEQSVLARTTLASELAQWKMLNQLRVTYVLHGDVVVQNMLRRTSRIFPGTRGRWRYCSWEN